MRLLTFSLLIGLLLACAHHSPTSWKTIVVKPKQTLYQIAQYYGLSVNQLCEKNRIDNPDHLQAGALLEVPVWGSLSPDQDDSFVFSQWIEEVADQPSKTIMNNDLAIAEPKLWIRPVESAFQANGLSVFFAPKEALPVKASRSGEVLFAGEVNQWDQSYVVIRHYQGYLSIYRGLGSIQVPVGRYVHQGDKLGDLEQDKDGKAMLYFEIRKNARRIDTASLLP